MYNKCIIMYYKCTKIFSNIKAFIMEDDFGGKDFRDFGEILKK